MRRLVPRSRASPPVFLVSQPLCLAMLFHADDAPPLLGPRRQAQLCSARLATETSVPAPLARPQPSVFDGQGAATAAEIGGGSGWRSLALGCFLAGVWGASGAARAGATREENLYSNIS